MTGLPMTPDALPLVPPAAPLAVCWDWEGVVSPPGGDAAAAAARVALLAFAAPDAAAFDPAALSRSARGGTVGAAATPDRVALYLVVPAVAAGAVLELEVRLGVGCVAAPVFAGAYAVGAPGARAVGEVELFALIGGLPWTRLEVWGRWRARTAKPVALRVLMDRGGAPPVVLWGAGVAKLYPAGSTLNTLT